METVGWQSDPNGRGTFTLVSSCVFTLTICVYSAMHLNVPPRGESSAKFWLRNIRWALLGIFGPELVVFIAWKQYLSAKAIAIRSQNRIEGETCPSREGGVPQRVGIDTSRPRTNSHGSASPWTIVHGFCAGMGCFTFLPNKIPNETGTPIIIDPQCERFTLTARGVALLADCGLLPDIEKNYLNDKSKSDGLSKLIACAQAAWLIVQVVGRLILGLQVTLLEINTLGHVLCALIIYVLWWHKPRMVLEPINLDGEWLGPLCAYMYLSSSISGQIRESASTFEDSTTEPEIAKVALYSEEPCTHTNYGIFRSSRNGATKQSSDSTLSLRELEFRTDKSVYSKITRSREYENAASSGTISGCFRPRPPVPESEKDFKGFTTRFDSSEECQTFGATPNVRWCMAAEAVAKYPAIKSRFVPITYSDASGGRRVCLQELFPEELLEAHCSNWSTRGLLPGDYGLVMGMALWFASMSFGAIHVAAWYDYFPTQTESWLWRCSAIYISWSGLVWCLINLAAHLSKPFDDYWNQTRLLKPPFAKSVPLVIVCLICGSLYAFARMYLVIEAFISIRKLPKSAYQTPEWMQIMPHL